MTHTYIIRTADVSDLSALVELNDSSNPHPWSAKLIADALSGRNNWVMVNHEQQIVAWLTASQVFDQSELELIVTGQQWRRQGLGLQLMQHWMVWATAQGCTELLLEVRASNVAAIALYEKLAFIQVGVRKGYYPVADGSKEAAVLMTCQLPQSQS